MPRFHSHVIRATLLGLLFAAPATAQITQAEFQARRDSLAARIDSGVVVAFGARTPVNDYAPFYQLPAFQYLTNFREPDAAFVLVAHGKRGQGTIFVMPIDPRRAFYYGSRPDTGAVYRNYGLRARPFASLSSFLDSLAGRGLPFYTLSDFEAADFASVDTLTRGRVFMREFTARHPKLVVRNAHPIVDQLRARKSAAELALLRKAAEISSEGHLAAMQLEGPRTEYALQAELEYTFRRLGSARPAYGSIVGAGENGTILHYMKDRGEAKPGDLVVIDAAAEYEGYAADVTRTLPVSGSFTPEQRTLYQLVYEAQLAAERNSKVGMRASAATDSSYDVRARGLVALGLAESLDAMFDPPWNVDCTRQPRACRQTYFWMIHGISHGLGLEVHDPTQYSTSDGTFKLGDVFTIEPGIYISSRMLDALPDTPRNRAFIAKVKSVLPKYENTGVRIEDDYIITEKGLERISSAPRSVEEVEAAMRKRAKRM